MKRRIAVAAIAAALAIVIGIAAATVYAPAVYPTYCGTDSHGSGWCIDYNTGTFRYDCPPPGNPCDVAKTAMDVATSPQRVLLERLEGGVEVGALAFVSILLIAIGLGSRWQVKKWWYVIAAAATVVATYFAGWAFGKTYAWCDIGGGGPGIPAHDNGCVVFRTEWSPLGVLTGVTVLTIVAVVFVLGRAMWRYERWR